MITIIKHGNKRKATCPRCLCEFFFEEEDIRYSGQREEYMLVDCPDCHHSIDVSRT